jgi:hypothetical protein
MVYQKVGLEAIHPIIFDLCACQGLYQTKLQVHNLIDSWICMQDFNMHEVEGFVFPNM